MLRSVAVTRIAEGLGFRVDQNDRIVLRMQEEQRDLERGKTLPKFLIREDATLTTVTNQAYVDLPSDFLRRADRLPRYTALTTDISTDIPWRSYDAAYKAYADSDAAGPKVLVLRHDTIYIFPTPDRAYTITWDYYKKDTILSSDVENLWLENAPELIIGGAGLRLAYDLRNKEAIAVFTNMYKAARVAWFNEDVVQELDDQPLLVGANN
jgi:hypothetical protein